MFQFLKNDKSLKKDIRLIFLIAIGACFAIFLLSLVAGCALQSSREDSANYVAQAQPQGYPCPECGFLISDKDVSANIRTKNKCLNCQKIFFGVPVANKTQKYKGNRGEKVVSSELKSHGPRSIYESDIDYQYFWVGGESFNETETGYSFLSWSFGDRRVKIYRVTPHWTNTRYHLGRR